MISRYVINPSAIPRLLRVDLHPIITEFSSFFCMNCIILIST